MIGPVDSGVPAWLGALLVLEYVALGFTVLYAVANTVMILAGFHPARRDVQAMAFHDLDLMDHDPDCPPVAILVPAYNEERGIVDSVRALLALDYPRLEILVCNDGSKDATLARLREAFRLQRRDVTSGGRLETAAVRAVYEAVLSPAGRIQRLVVIDKDNGGRADALNCALNASRSPYFVTIDADSILDPQALKLIVRIFQDDPGVLAAGGQIGIANDAELEQGKVVSVQVPARYLPLCQTLEYVRSFTTARTGWSRFGGLMILSGAFLVTRRETAIDVGGFLTGRVRSRLLEEYSGAGNGTVGEDMELIVRLHRHERENGRRARIVHTPLPVCWTEVPDTWKVLSRQRRRWHRGLLEIVRYHGRMLLDPAYGRIGLVSFPYLVLFELLGPYLEALGYLLLPVLVAFGALDVPRAALLAAVALGMGMLHSSIAVLCATWLEPVVPARSAMRSLLGMDRWRDRALLVAACALGELGYRQATVWWRLQGTVEFLRGRGTWGDMERRGFRSRAARTTAAVVAIGLALAPIRVAPAHAAELRDVSLVAGVELADGRPPGSWTEARVRWADIAARERALRAITVGAYAVDRAGDRDAGFLLGAEGRLGGRAGAAVELRAGPTAGTTARWAAQFEGEGLLVRPVSGSWLIRYSRFAEVSVVELAPGAVVYAGEAGWLALRGHLARSSFDAGPTEGVWGASALLSVPARGAEWRVLAAHGGETYLAGGLRESRRIRDATLGLSARFGVRAGLRAEIGTFARFPDRGADQWTVVAGVHRRLGAPGS